jgi:signal transduction histidine kinase
MKRSLHHRVPSLAIHLKYGIVGLVALSILLVSTALIFLSVRDHFDQVLIIQQARSEVVAEEISTYITDLQRKLGYLSRVQGFSELPKSIQQSMLEGLVRQNDAYETIMVLDRQGDATVTLSPYGLHVDPQDTQVVQLFKQVFNLNADVVSPVELLTVQGTSTEQIPIVTFAMPIHNQKDKVDGVLMARVNLRFLWTVINNRAMGDTGYAYVVDPRNLVIAQRWQQNQHQYFLTDITTRPFIDDLRTIGMSQVKTTIQPSSAYVGLYGLWVFSGVSIVPDVNWLTVVEIPVSEAAASLKQLLIAMMIVLGLVVAIAIISGILFSRNVVRPLRHLTAAAAEVSQGNFQVRVPVSHYQELNVLAQAFHIMGDQLFVLIDDLTAAKFKAETSLQKLKKTQAQLVQTEKLSGLGQMIAGIAHEINNPVNFIYANLDYLKTYSNDLMELVDLYQTLYPEGHPQIQTRLEAIEFEFLKEDLQKIVQSMDIGTSRIRDIVQSLRNFSRLDEAEVKNVDLHEGIDSTLLILNSRLKGTDFRDQITIVKHYGSLPKIECYAGQLNQVFMNVLSNAIDALDEFCWQQMHNSSPDMQSLVPLDFVPQIIIVTALENREVVVTITDNGPGISAEIQSRIFDPFFTTKPVGKGTGLGMSISYQIVTEVHNGSIQCISQPHQGSTFIIRLPQQMV